MNKQSILKSIFAVAVFAIICTFTSISASADGQYKDLQVLDTTDTTIKIEWEEPEDYTKTYIGWGTTEESCMAMLETQKNKLDAGLKTYTIRNLKPGTGYYVSISYKDKYGKGVVLYVKEFMVFTNPGQVKGVKLNEWSAGLKKATVLWTEQSAATGYEYQLKDAKGTVVTSGDVKGPYAVTLDVENDTVYSLTARAYADRDGNKVYGKWSKAAYLLPQPEVTKGSASAKGLQFTWQKVSGATNYTIYASTSAKKNFKKIATTTKTSYTIKKLGGKINKSKNYYVYVIANKKASGSTTSSQKLFKTKIYGPLFNQIEF